MIQFNLLPDVKLEYIKAQRTSRLILSTAVLVSSGAIVLLLLVLSVEGLQTRHLHSLTASIASESSKLQNEPQIGKILTVQNQLESITTLHSQKPAVSNLFDYLNQVTPNQVSITSLHFDFVGHTATLTGNADALSTINQFIDTLKFTTYTSSQGTGSGNAPNGPTGTNSSSCNSDNLPSSNGSSPAFTNVVLSNFGLNNQNGVQANGANASFAASFGFDPSIFDITKTVKLSVPKLISTRSCLDKPSDLFSASTTSKPSGGQ